MEIPGGGAQTAVAQEDLDGPRVRLVFEQMGGEAVAKRMNGHVLVQATALACGPTDAMRSR